MNVLVTGGTGTLGRRVVSRLRQSGHRATILTRHPRGHVDAVAGDLTTGAGLQRAIAGIDSVIHAATTARESLSGAADVKGTRRVIEAARQARVKHFVYISIVGIDRVAYPYYRTKLACEAVVREGGVPWSILRATQFHELMEVFLRRFSRVPRLLAAPLGWQFQPVDSDEVARRIVEIGLGDPAQMLPDFGGPEILDFEAIARAWLVARKDGRKLVNLPLPIAFSRQFADGLLLCPDHREGTITFEQYLAQKYAQA